MPGSISRWLDNQLVAPNMTRIRKTSSIDEKQKLEQFKADIVNQGIVNN